MELNREQIIKGLKNFITNAHTKIYYPDGDDLIGDALALINELTEEKKNLEYTLEGVMHSVDKWLDGAELEQDEVNRAATMREKTLQIVEKLTEENERLRAEEKQSQTLINTLHDKLDEGYAKFVNEERANAVREMLRRIKEDAVSVSLLSNPPKFMLEIREDALDQIAKEMLEGNKNVNANGL